MEIPLSRYNLRSAKDENLQAYAAYASKGHTVTRNSVTGRIRVVFDQDVLDREDEEMRLHDAQEAVESSDDDDDERPPVARQRSLSDTSTLTWPSDDEEKDEVGDVIEGRAEDEPVDPRFVTPDLSVNAQPFVPRAPRKKTLLFDERQWLSHEPTPTPMPPAGGPTDLAASLSSIEEDDDIQIIDMDQDMDDLDGAYADDEASFFRTRSWIPDLIHSTSSSSSSSSTAGPSTPTSGRSLVFGNSVRIADSRLAPRASLGPAVKVEPDEEREITPFCDRYGKNVEDQVEANAAIFTALPSGPNGTEVVDYSGRRVATTEKRGRVDAEWYRYYPVAGGGFARKPTNWAPRWRR